MASNGKGNGSSSEQAFPWELRYWSGGFIYGQAAPLGSFCNQQDARVTFADRGGTFFVEVAPMNKRLCPLGKRTLVATPVAMRRFRGRYLVAEASINLDDQCVHVAVPKHIEWEVSEEVRRALPCQ